MGMPNGIGAVDLLIGFPHTERSVDDLSFRSLLKDEGSARMQFPAEYMFKDLPENVGRKMYPIFQACIDLDVPIIANAGLPGPRVPMDCQDVRHFDQVCYDFPELRTVMCHGAEPWEALAVKLMLKWPGLYFMPSGFAPRYYPKAIIDFANTRGSDKIMYAGFYPMGLTLERIFTELPQVSFKDEVWPKFLRENAMRVFKRREP